MTRSAPIGLRLSDNEKNFHVIRTAISRCFLSTIDEVDFCHSEDEKTRAKVGWSRCLLFRRAKRRTENVGIEQMLSAALRYFNHFQVFTVRVDKQKTLFLHVCRSIKVGADDVWVPTAILLSTRDSSCLHLMINGSTSFYYVAGITSPRISYWRRYNMSPS